MKIHSLLIFFIALFLTIVVFSCFKPNKFPSGLNANQENVKIKKLPEALIIGSPKCGKYLKGLF